MISTDDPSTLPYADSESLQQFIRQHATPESRVYFAVLSVLRAKGVCLLESLDAHPLCEGLHRVEIRDIAQRVAREQGWSHLETPIGLLVCYSNHSRVAFQQIEREIYAAYMEHIGTPITQAIQLVQLALSACPHHQQVIFDWQPILVQTLAYGYSYDQVAYFLSRPRRGRPPKYVQRVPHANPRPMSIAQVVDALTQMMSLTEPARPTDWWRYARHGADQMPQYWREYHALSGSHPHYLSTWCMQLAAEIIGPTAMSPLLKCLHHYGWVSEHHNWQYHVGWFSYALALARSQNITALIPQPSPNETPRQHINSTPHPHSQPQPLSSAQHLSPEDGKQSARQSQNMPPTPPHHASATASQLSQPASKPHPIQPVNETARVAFQLYSDLIHPRISDHMAAQINLLAAQIEDVEVWRYAFACAEERNARNWAYVRAVVLDKAGIASSAKKALSRRTPSPPPVSRAVSSATSHVGNGKHFSNLHGNYRIRRPVVDYDERSREEAYRKAREMLAQYHPSSQPASHQPPQTHTTQPPSDANQQT